MRLLYVHPALRIYRAPVFEALGQRLGFEFMFTMINPADSHAGRETARLLQAFKAKYHQCMEIKEFLITNLSTQLIGITKYDIVVFSCLTSVPFLLLAAVVKALGHRVVLFDETWRYPYAIRRYRIVLPWVRYLLAHCVDAVIAAGSRAKRMFVQEFGLPPSRIAIAYNWTPPPAEVPQRVRQTVSQRVRSATQNRLIVLYLGRIVRYKGLDVLIRSVPSWEAQADLVVVGAGPFEQECRRLAVTLGVSSRVHFLGPCDSSHVRAYYELADVFALPTRFLFSEPVNCESWGYTVNEAMLCSLPVVATDAVGAAHDLIMHGKTGLMARAGDAADLGRCIAELLHDETRRRAMGQAAREFAWRRTSCEQTVQAYVDVVTRLMESDAR